MAIGYLNERTRELIEMIIKGSSVLSIKEIALQMSVSTRTIYNELDKANSWLSMEKLPQIEVIRGKVQLFSAEEAAQIEAVLEKDQPTDNYIFTPTERSQMIICQIILSKEPVYIENLMNACLVSRNTIFTDLQAVISQLAVYQLELKYEKKKGYWIDGDPIRVRAIFFLYFNMLEPLFSTGKIRFLQMEELVPYLERIEMVEKKLKVSYVRNDKIALAAMISVMERPDTEVYVSEVSVQKVKESKEYELVEEYFPELAEQEKVYLTLHFLGGRLESYSRNGEDSTPNTFILEISKNLVTEFEKQACVTFRKRENLVQNLYRHIKSSIYRYRFGIQIGNPMGEDIKREYPYIFDVMRVTARYLEQQIGVQISDSEVSYLALHFGAHLEFAEHDEKELRILVVCVNGVATGNMISHELMRILPQAKIVGVTAASTLMNPQDICDIIVSSVKLKTVVPVIVVNPILNDFDRRNILNHPLIRSRFGFVDIEALFQLVKKYVPSEHYKELRNDLEMFFTHSREEKQPVLNPEVWRLTDFLTEDRIVFINSEGYSISRYNGKEKGDKDGSKKENPGESRKEVAGKMQRLQEGTIPEVSLDLTERTSWERALYAVAAPLIKRGTVGISYVESVIERLKEAGPYMFVTKDLILAHSRPESGVKHLDLSIGIAKDGVEFEQGKTARIIFCLAVEDQQKHMGILRDIRKSMAKPAQIDELTREKDSAQVCKVLREKLINI